MTDASGPRISDQEFFPQGTRSDFVPNPIWLGDINEEAHELAVQRQQRLKAMAPRWEWGADGILKKQKTILLRVPKHHVPGEFGMSVFQEMEATANATVEVDELNADAIRRVQNDDTVLVTAPVLPMRLIEPLDPSRDFPPEVPETGEVTWGVKAVGAPSSPFTGAGVTVAVLDTGIDAAHPAFTGVELVTHDFTGGDSANDTHGHGTHCAGTIFGHNVNNLRIGVATGVTKALIGKVIGAHGGGSDIVSTAMMWAAEQGANVISMSLAIDFPGFVEYLVEHEGRSVRVATSLALEQYRANILLFENLSHVLDSRAGLGAQAVVVVAATGNESGRNEMPPFAINVAPPASSEGVVAVGALGQTDAGLRIAPFSNTRATVAAPGVNISSAKIGGGELSVKNGTSMATPHVAGVAALWTEKLRNQGLLNPRTLEANLIASATFEGLVADTDPLDVGAGLIQAPKVR